MEIVTNFSYVSNSYLSLFQLALAKSILGGDSASRDIKMTSIKNFGADREFNNFELFYQELLDEENKLNQLESERKSLQEEMITHATQNQENGISIHDGFGGNWGANLADMFGIKGNDNIDEKLTAKKEAAQELVDASFDFEEIWNQYENSHAFISFTGFMQWWNVNKNAIVNEKAPAVVEDENIETIVAYIGKGRKQKRVELKVSNNLLDSLSSKDVASGVQLAFAF